MSILTAFVVLALVAISASSVIPEPAKFESWEGRIAGGSNASPGSIPYQASLRTASNDHFCGATIINNHWVVSAANCTIGRTTANTLVVVGTHLRLSGGVTHTTSIIRNHPNFDANFMANDISLVKTVVAITFNNLVQPRSLGSDFVYGERAIISGWGQLRHPGPAPDNLQWIPTFTMESNEDCRDRIERQNPGGSNATVFDNTICALTMSGRGTCFGDCGGPLVSGDNLIGVISWGIACARGFPDVYARISSHITWLNQQLMENGIEKY